MRPIEIVLKVLGASAVTSSLAGVKDSARDMADGVKTSGDKTASVLDGAKANADQLKDSLEKVRDAGLKIGATGAVVVALGGHLADAFIGADRLGGRMESLLSAKGLSGASDEIKKLASDLAAATGGDDDQIGADLASAIASGRVAGLRAMGLAFTAEGEAAIDAAGKISANAKSQETLNQIMIAGAAAVSSMRGTLSEATLQTSEFQVRFGNAEEAIGAGSARARVAILGGMVGPLITAIEQNPGLADTAGAITYVGGAALTATGSVISFASQIALTTMAFPGMMASGVTAWTAIRTAAITAGAAMWGAIAPLLPMILAVVAALAIAGAAFYALDKITHAKEDRELAANIAKGDEAGQKLLEIENAKRVKRGKKTLTIEEFQGDPNIDDKATPTDPTAQLEAIKAQSKALAAPPTMPPPTTFPVAPLVGAPPRVGNPSAIDALSTLKSVATMSRGVVNQAAQRPSRGRQSPDDVMAGFLQNVVKTGSLSGARDLTDRGRGAETGAVRTARIESQRENARGDVTIQFEKITIHPQGIGDVEVD